VWRTALSAAAAALAHEYAVWDTQHGSQKPDCPRCGRRMARLRRAPRQIVTRAGIVHVTRQVYHCRQCNCTHAPLDAALELDDTQYSKPARQWCVRMGAALPFGEGQELLRELTAVHADASVIEAFCNRAGQRLEDAVSTAIDQPPTIPLHTPEHLCVSVDGAQAPIRDKQRPWQEVRVGVLFTTTPGPDGPQLDQREHLAFLGPMEAFAPRLWERAASWGAAAARTITFIGDGAAANWHLADLLFSGARQILDFYHACEHLRAIRDLIFKPDDPDATAWLDHQCRQLKNGRWCAVMTAIAAHKPRRGCVKKLRTELAYFRNNRHRMHYLHFRRLGLYIGSGIVESACKQVVTRRIKVSGARWKPIPCQHMLHLRCAYLSNPSLLREAA